VVDDDRVDLSAVDPTLDRDRLEGAVGRIVRSAEPELAARRRASSAIALIATWRRPMLAAAALVLVIGASVLIEVPQRDPGPAAPQRLAQTLRIPSTVAGWMMADDVPTPAQLLALFAEEP
jgi:hypothetical protein